MKHIQKQENIWHSGETAEQKRLPDADLRDFPPDAEMINEWRRGVEPAQLDAADIGMRPGSDDDDAPDWFQRPYGDRMLAQQLENQVRCVGALRVCPLRCECSRPVLSCAH